MNKKQAGPGRPRHDPKTDSELNNALRKILDGSKLTQGELASKTGLSESTIGHIRRGDRTWISVSTVKKIAQAFSLKDKAIADLVKLAE